MKKKSNEFVVPETFMSGAFKINNYYDPGMMDKPASEVGLNCLGSQEIYIQTPVEGRLSEGCTKQAFLHELVHQLLWQMGRAALCHDEVFVDGFAHALFQFFETGRGDLLGIWRKDEKK